jgi:raffinose/stachyose/melibiose transport system permease protein
MRLPVLIKNGMMNFMKIKKEIRREVIYSMLGVLPALIIFFTFTYVPLIMTLKYSFTDWDGFGKKYNFIGMQNFITMFKEPDIMQAFLNTIYLAVFSIIIGTVLQLGLALILYDKFKGKSFVRAIFYMTCIISPVIVSMTWVGFFQYTGVINEFLKSIHLNFLVFDWLGDIRSVKPVLIFINAWQWVGYGMVIYLTGLNSVPVDIYESGMLDGATGIKKFRYITLPLIMPAVTVNAFISITGALRIFDMPFVLTAGGPMNASKTISMSIYENAFAYERFGYASSIGLLFFIIIAIVTVTQLRVTRKMEVEY